MLDGIGAKLGLPESVIEQTAYLFRKIAAKKILAGRSTAGMLCAAIYITCRMTNTPRTLQDVASAGNVNKKSIQRKLNVSNDFELSAYRILDLSARNGVSASKNPMAMASAAVYLASIKNGEKVPQLKISKVSGISAVTIRDRTKEILKKVGGEIDG